METFWFIALTFMFIMYVILDGFDLGVGILHLLAGKSDHERRMILNAIGPVWDGNEVWLIAAGGVMYFAFPHFYASCFSGFYLPLMIVLWLLILRAIGIEFRSHIQNPLWKSFWDVIFAIASILLTICLGAALGNIVRGVPLNAEGYFFEPLWTTFTVAPNSGIFDWFTLLMGFMSFFTLTAHGANYLSLKTENAVHARSRNISRASGWFVLAAFILTLIAITYIHPEFWNNYLKHGWGFIFPLMGVFSLAGMLIFRYQNKDAAAFVSSCSFIVSMGGTTAFGLFPNLLLSLTNPEYNLTVYNSAAGAHSLKVGVIWWTIGILFASAYFIFLYRTYRGKVMLSVEGEGY